MFKGLIIAAAKSFNQGSADKNGKMPIILVVVAGKCPNRTVLSGTVAENEGFEIGKTYLVQVTETEPDAEYGRRFTFTKLAEASLMDIISAPKAIGQPEVFDVSEAESKSTETVFSAAATAKAPKTAKAK